MNACASCGETGQKIIADSKYRVCTTMSDVLWQDAAHSAYAEHHAFVICSPMASLLGGEVSCRNLRQGIAPEKSRGH